MTRDGRPSAAPTRPWLLVVARGQRQLAAQLEALFRGDARIRVIEDRRDERTLLPRAGTPRRYRPEPRAAAGTAGRSG